jgi:gamma-glutamylcyclotransferase
MTPMDSSDTPMITVFAYGSNMLTRQMKERAPSAQSIGTAILKRFRLRWNKRSKDGSGKCSIEETGCLEDFVWGVLFELNLTDKHNLDAIEGLGKGYGERALSVLSNDKSIRALAYYATSIDLNARPYDWYRDIVTAGAREHGLPIEYIRTIEVVNVIQDLDVERTRFKRRGLDFPHR